MALPLVGFTIAGVVAAVSQFMVPLIVRWALIALGLSLVTYTGLSSIQDYVLDMVYARWDNLPVSVVSYLEYCGVLQAVNILTASAVASLTIKFGVGAAFRAIRSVS